MNVRASVLLSVCLLLVAATSAQAQAPLTNEDVLQMVQAGFGEETIIKAIEANEPAYDTSVQALVELKKVGVSEKIIGAMLSATRRKTEATVAPTDTTPDGLPQDIGVYLKGPDELLEVEPEIVTWKTGGLLKRMATAGLTKGHVNGKVKNKHSPLQLAPPLEFIFRCPEGVSVGEYQLLRLSKKGNRREFRAMTGGIFHASGGAGKNAVPFEYKKIASRTYRVQLTDLKKGEYGFLPPGAAVSRSAASIGKIYSFGIVE